MAGSCCACCCCYYSRSGAHDGRRQKQKEAPALRTRTAIWAIGVCTWLRLILPRRLALSHVPRDPLAAPPSDLPPQLESAHKTQTAPLLTPSSRRRPTSSAALFSLPYEVHTPPSAARRTSCRISHRSNFYYESLPASSSAAPRPPQPRASLYYLCLRLCLCLRGSAREHSTGPASVEARPIFFPRSRQDLL